jgi:tetratricopeptide (TPR) repeat protein
VTRLESAGQSADPPVALPSGLLDPDEVAARLAWEQSGADDPPIEVGLHAGVAVTPTAPPEPGVQEPFGVEWSRIWPESPRGLPSPPGRDAAEPAPIDRIAEEHAWPSAKEILAAARAERTAPAPARPRSRKRPEPTVARAPEQWALPAWMAVPPAFAVVLVGSIGGLALAWAWAQDDRAAGALANHLLAGRQVPSAGLTVEPLANPTWWGTTADHLLWRAAALGRVDGDPARAEEVEFLLGQAAQASPAHPGVRFALARAASGGEAGRDAVPSRDVFALAVAARNRLRAGRTEEALGLYREALAMAAEADPRRAEPPAFDPDSRVQRHRLPNEDLFAPVLRDMAAESGWTPSEWTAALPDRGVVWLAAYRVLRDRGGAGADEVLDGLLNRPAPSPDDSTVHAAVELAAQAEGHAFRGEWAEAESRYLEAIRRVGDPGLRRTWWLNVSEVYSRLNDLDKRHAARENAWGAAGAELVEEPGPDADDDGATPGPDSDPIP